MNGEETPKNGSYTWALTDLSGRIAQLGDHMDERFEKVESRLDDIERAALIEKGAREAMQGHERRRWTTLGKVGAILGTGGIIAGEFLSGKVHL